MKDLKINNQCIDCGYDLKEDEIDRCTTCEDINEKALAADKWFDDKKIEDHEDKRP
jgi:hypothetical protein